MENLPTWCRFFRKPGENIDATRSVTDGCLKAIHGQGPIHLQQLVGLQHIYNIRSRKRCDLLQEANVISKKTLGDRAHLCAAPKLWNSLPNHVSKENLKCY